jgi:predicted phosphodiesterase
MKAIVLTDVHANLPALQAALAAAKQEGYDALYHLGDAIAIGPHPTECLDVLLNLPNTHLLMGNHDMWFVNCVPQARPPWMLEGEQAHRHWTHAQIDPALRNVIAAWPYQIDQDIEDVGVQFTHYALDESGQQFKPVIVWPSPDDLDALFDPGGAALVFYGHHHDTSDLQGRARYLNPGSLGAYAEPVARYFAVTFCQGAYTVEHRAIPYDDSSLCEAFIARNVPDRATINRYFFGSRLTF